MKNFLENKELVPSCIFSVALSSKTAQFKLLLHTSNTEKSSHGSGHPFILTCCASCLTWCLICRQRVATGTSVVLLACSNFYACSSLIYISRHYKTQRRGFQIFSAAMASTSENNLFRKSYTFSQPHATHTNQVNLTYRTAQMSVLYFAKVQIKQFHQPHFGSPQSSQLGLSPPSPPG